MGEVYRARDTRLKREVAIKMLQGVFASDPERLARFHREAELLATLNHPNICALYHIADAPNPVAGARDISNPQSLIPNPDSIQFLVMELVEGEDLSAVIARQGHSAPAAVASSESSSRGATASGGGTPRAIEIDDALRIARQIAEALEAAHDQGIVHRDLKPANIKVRADGVVKVLDFGLAKALESAGSKLQDPAYGLSQVPTMTTPAMMTGAGVILGTAAYMSPEQARGKPTDRRTDIWSFGCVLFEMLTGKTPFDAGDTVSDAVASILKNDPDWTALPSATPAHVRALLRRCLQKDLQKRLPHIGVARLDIDEGPTGEVGAGRLDGVAERQPRSRRGMLTLGMALATAALAAAAGFYARPSPPQPGVARFSFALGEGQQFTNTGRRVVAMSPDGTQMVYVANQRLWLRSMSDPNARPIPGTEMTQGVTSPVFSPDGRSLAFFSGADSTLKRIAVSGGPPVTICPAENVYGMSWGADGIVVGQGPGGILRVSPSGGTPESLVAVKAGEVADGPQMLPGDLLLFTIATGTGFDRWDRATAFVQSLASGERTAVIEGGSGAQYLPTGHLVYARSGVLYAVPFDLRRRQVTAGPVPIIEGIRRANAQQTGVAHFSVARGGSLMFVPGPVSTGGGQRGLALFDVQGRTEPVKLPPGAYTSPRVSRDGKLVAFVTDDGQDANVWVYDLSGASAMRRLTFGGA